MVEIILIIIFIVLIIGFGLLWNTLKKSGKPKEDQSFLLLSQRMEALTQEINNQLERSRQASERSAQNVSSQVQSFTKGMTELRETVHQVKESVKDVSSFQEMFRSPKLRGTWGELTLEAILKEYFPRNGYQTQHEFSSGEIVDAVLKLPNNLLLPIDSKFSWENFKKMTESESETGRITFRKIFISDIKKRIDEIAGKYILPSEGTIDMALMYVPAESVYYEVIQNVKDDDIAEYARKRKIYIVSPNTLYITLSAIIHWFKDVQLQKQTGDIMKRLEVVIKDATTLASEFQKLGNHLSDAHSAYDRTDKRLNLLVERTQKVIQAEHEDQEKLIAPKRERPESEE
ncbi:DNA recombination protein RmuC [Candidatus Jorgensenbacteria bacterium]|nr:DNA recombination protein RmuC [Candidatus Jorgensenbacteria bacterium]